MLIIKLLDGLIEYFIKTKRKILGVIFVVIKKKVIFKILVLVINSAIYVH